MPSVEVYDWPAIIEICKELVGTVGTFRALRGAVVGRIGRDIPEGTLRSGLARNLGLDSRQFTLLKETLLGDGGDLTPLAKTMLNSFRKRRGEALTIMELCEAYDRGPKSIVAALEELEEQDYHIQITDDTHVLMPETVAPTRGVIPLELWTKPAEIHRYGVVADTHLCNRNERLDALNALYDIYQEEGIEIVLHAGNLIDGEFRYNRHELLAHGVEGQIVYAAYNYPERDGITTKFISAACHEGWWAKDIGLDIGRRMENGLREHGRTDFEWLGHIERDLSLHDDNPQAILRIFHPGGGMAYATSYPLQKHVETWHGGEKPSICIFGHYHKHGLFYPREVWSLIPGCVCDQTSFMRIKKLGAEVGGCILEIHMTAMGGVGRVKYEFFPFYNQDYYKRWDYQAIFGI
jgi:predicted phosphodiesterase